MGFRDAGLRMGVHRIGVGWRFGIWYSSVTTNRTSFSNKPFYLAILMFDRVLFHLVERQVQRHDFQTRSRFEQSVVLGRSKFLFLSMNSQTYRRLTPQQVQTFIIVYYESHLEETLELQHRQSNPFSSDSFCKAFSLTTPCFSKLRTSVSEKKGHFPSNAELLLAA